MRPGMASIPSGLFAMGCDRAYPEEAPVREVAVDAFEIDATPVTNDAFARFVEGTGYVTLAERGPDPGDYPAEFAEVMVPGSFVFVAPEGPVSLADHSAWWRFVEGASWREPLGPGSAIDGLGDHPVVHLALEDAEAYAGWAGKALPTEAQWEFAARGGIEGALFVWGDEHDPPGGPHANVWQGRFPYENLMTDGHERTSPVGAYPPNGYGLYDMAGNVWEWTADWYADRSSAAADRPCCAPPPVEESHDPLDLDVPVPRRVIKGGSHLCAPNYCLRYRPAARLAQPIDTTTSHVGFRCVAT
jgi:sulfatase modifying factor 1